MNRPDWLALGLNPRVLAEPMGEDGRIILWRPADRDDRYQHWDRLSTTARPEITLERGLRTVAASSVRARERLGGGGLFGSIAARWRGDAGTESWPLPGGGSAERCGGRRTGLLLVWTDDPTGPVGEESLRARWPEGEVEGALGERIWIVSPRSPAVPAPSPDAAPSGMPEPPERPTRMAEEALQAARRAGDPGREAVALADLGIFAYAEGDPGRAIDCLARALAMFREAGDRARQVDAATHLGEAMMATGQVGQGKAVLEQALAMARAVGDPFAEKIALERLGTAAVNLRDPAAALAIFDEALVLTRRLGDRQQEPRLLWSQAIALADLGRRDDAIARSQESIDLLARLGKPEASWYGAQLQRYRMDLSALGVGPDGGAAGPTAWMPAGPAGGPPTGPGLLRMAASASRAMMRFLGSGLKTAPPATQRRRMDTCLACPHHTGLRCRVCGCFTAVKSRMLHESCPIGMWPE